MDDTDQSEGQSSSSSSSSSRYESTRPSFHEAKEYPLLTNEVHRTSDSRTKVGDNTERTIVIMLNGDIQVFCRCRPLTGVEIDSGCNSVVKFESSTEIRIVGSNTLKKSFVFDHVFRPDDSPDAIRSKMFVLMKSALEGFNVCIFAYGQTGTGKTHTFEGTYLSLKKLLCLSKSSTITKFKLYLSMIEIYEENVRDLLLMDTEQRKKLEIKISADGVSDLVGVTNVLIIDPTQLWNLFSRGRRARFAVSSKATCLLRVTVVGVTVVPVGETNKNSHRISTTNNFWLVDLPGSDHIGRILADGDWLKESQFRNKSLAALGDVITSLATHKVDVPYEKCMLTRLLQSSLGNDCKILLFVQISPNVADLGETISSLNFATRLRGAATGRRVSVESAKRLEEIERTCQKLRSTTIWHYTKFGILMCFYAGTYASGGILTCSSKVRLLLKSSHIALGFFAFAIILAFGAVTLYCYLKEKQMRSQLKSKKNKLKGHILNLADQRDTITPPQESSVNEAFYDARLYEILREISGMRSYEKLNIVIMSMVGVVGVIVLVCLTIQAVMKG